MKERQELQISDTRYINLNGTLKTIDSWFMH